MSNHLDRCLRRADAVTACALARHGKYPAQLAMTDLKAVIAETDAILAVVDMARAHDARHAPNTTGPGRPATLAGIDAMMAGERPV